MKPNDIFDNNNIGISYPKNEVPNEQSHADYYVLIPHAYLWDSDLDFYTIGVYLRLLSLCHYKRCKEDLYQYGKKEYIDNALTKLEKNQYIKIVEDEEIIIL